MPESDPAVRGPAIELIRSREERIEKGILDIGVGSGFYGRSLRGMFRAKNIYGIEIWPPYLTAEHLKWYSTIFVADALAFDYELLRDRVSLLIAADVVEHFEKDDAVALVDVWKRYFPWLVITIPIQNCPQGAYKGNVHETHLHQWTVAEVESDLGLKLVRDCGICGLFQRYE